MAGIRVVTDSSCDLPQALADELGIEIVPLSIRFGAEEFTDRLDLDPASFWSRCAASPTLPETAAPSPGQFAEAFQRAAQAGADGVVCITISSKMSATIQSARIAADEVASTIAVRVVDSLNASLGVGLTVVSAARMASAGKGIDDVAGEAEDLVGRTRLLAAIDTLENLRKGGRIGGAQAFLGSMLSIKPLIAVRDGEVHEESKQRTRSRAVGYLVDKVKAMGPLDMLGVMHGEAPDVDDLVAKLSGIVDPDDLVVNDIGSVIGTHVGKGCIGIVAQLSK